LVRQLKTAVFSAEIEVRIYRTPALKVLMGPNRNRFENGVA